MPDFDAVSSWDPIRVFDLASLMRTPALRLAAGLAIGIVMADATAGQQDTATVFAAVVGTAMAALIYLERSRHAAIRIIGPSRLIASMALAVLCGVCSYARVVDRGSKPWKDLVQNEQELEIAGRIVRVSPSARGSRYTVDRLVVLPRREVLNGRLLVYEERGLENGVRPGSLVSVVCTPRQLPRLRNPNDFDYGRYLRRRGYKAVAYVERGGVHAVALPTTVAWVSRLRRSIRDNIRDGMADPEARAILVALMLGDRSGISSELREDFVDAGLVHLLAVSGLHVMVVGFVFFNIAGPLLRRCRLAWSSVEFLRVAITVMLLLTYMHLTGKPDSVVRAVFMASILIVAPLIRRNSGSLNSLWVATAVILSFSPWSLFEAGFQLSVSAVAGIVCFNPMMEHARSFRRLAVIAGKNVVSNVTVTASATVGVTPVLLFHFGEVSLAGLLLNISSVPLAAASLISGVLASTLALAPGTPSVVAAVYSRAAETSLQMLIETARLGSEYLGVLSVNVFPSAPMLLAAALSIWALSLRAASGRWLLLAAAVVCVVIAQTSHLRSHLLQETEVVFFDVGQGDATLLRTASGRTMLVDAGDSRRGITPAERSIVPHLRRLNTRKLDLVILSHAHSDHIGGVPALFEHVEIGRIAMTNTSSRSRLLGRIKSLADSLQTSVTYLASGDTLFLDASLSIQVLWPRREHALGVSENDRSLVLRVQAPGGKILLTGDIERLAELELVAGFRRILPADLVKVAHHGSRTSSTGLMLNAVGGSALQHRFAVVSVAERNRYGLPDEEVTSAWRRHGYEVLSTAGNGAVWFTMSRNGSQLQRWSKHR